MSDYIATIQASQNDILRALTDSPDGKLSEDIKKNIQKTDDALTFGRPIVNDTPESKEKQATLIAQATKIINTGIDNKTIIDSNYPQNTIMNGFRNKPYIFKKQPYSEKDIITQQYNNPIDVNIAKDAYFPFKTDIYIKNSKQKFDNNIQPVISFKNESKIEPEIDPTTGRVRRKFDLE